MKKRVITIGVLMMSGLAFSQVGIGVRAPHKSALLELKANEGEYRGMLIPRIPLKGLTDKSTINKGDIATSLLVFNITDNDVLTPGFYYWKGTEWVRVIDSKDVIDNLDNFPRNSVLGVKGDELVLLDTKGGEVKTPIKDLNIVTTITEVEKGKYVYTNELGDKKVIDVTGNVINNITEILKDETVVEEIYNSVAAKGKATTATDGSIKIDNGEKAVLNPMQISIADKGVSPSKIAPGANGTFLITTKSGTVKWVSATDESIKEILTLNQAITLLEDNKDGTLTYYDESCFDKDGKFIEGSTGSNFDSNTLKVVATTDGKYSFYDGRSQTVPVATIDVKGTVVENITEILNEKVVKEQVFETVATQGKKVSGDDAVAIVGGDKATLSEMTISLKDKGVSSAKIKPGADKQLLVTKNGVAQWVAATDEIIQEAVKANEKVTVLVDHHNGKFTYYNENGIDKNGAPIIGKGELFDANTLRIVERKDKGIYDFFDGTSLDTPLMTISTRAKSIYLENSSTIIQGDNLQEVIDNIIQKIEVAQGKPATLSGQGILINGDPQLAGSVLKDMELTIANDAIITEKIKDGAITTTKINDGAVTTHKIKPGTDKYILVTKEGKVQWVAATDSIIKDVVKTNEVVTVVVNNNDGTYTYYNEKEIKADGTPDKTKGTKIDANTLTIADNGKGEYIFNDGVKHLATINIAGTVIENITEILNSTEVKEQIFETVAAQGKGLEKGDASIKIEGGEKAVLANAKISVADKGITPSKIEPGKDKYLLVTKDGVVQWVPASDAIIKDVIDHNETITVLSVNPNGTFNYKNESDIKNGGAGIDFDANTLKIEEKVGKQGVYVFYDGKTSLDAPLMTIDVAGTVIENITEILNSTEVKEQIYTTVAAQGKAVTSPKASIAVGGAGDKAVLNAMQLDIAKDGVTTTTIANKAVTPAKIEPGKKNGQLLVTNGNGDVQWIDATDAIIKDILKSKQAITYIEDLGKGSFTYYNEACFDADGVFIEGSKGEVFNANTLSIEEVTVNGKGTGTFEFYDLSQEDPIFIIDVKASVVNNITEILSNEDVKNEIFNVVQNKGQLVESTDGSVAITGGEKAALNKLILNIKESGIKTSHLKDGAVTTAKIGSVGSVNGAVLTADGLGKTTFVSPTDALTPAMQGDLVGEDTVINIAGGKNVLFGVDGKETKISINTGGITSAHIKNETILNDDIANKTISAAKLDGGVAPKGAVATVQADGTVRYQAISGDVIANKGNITTKDGVSVDNGTGKVLSNVEIGLTEKGVNIDRITPGTDKYILVTKDGTVQWVPASDAIIKDVVNSNETVTILSVMDNGTFTYQNENDIKNGTAGVTFDANTLTIKEVKDVNDKGTGTFNFFDKTSEDTPIATINVSAAVINSITTILNDVTVQGDIFNTVANQGKALTSKDGSLNIPEGNKAGLAELNIGIATEGVKTVHIANKNITAAKLDATGAAEGAVATVGLNGVVSYQPLKSDVITDKAPLTTDGIIEITNAGLGADALLKAVNLKIKDKGIGTAQLTDNAVTNDKISSEGAGGEKRVLISGLNKDTKWVELSNIVTETAGNLTTDGIIEMSGGDGVNAVLEDIKLSIADKSITKAKLSSVKTVGVNENEDLLLATDGTGGFKFIPKDVVATPTGDLTSVSTLEISDGVDAVLKDISIDVKDKGITPAKISSEGALENAVLTADGNGNVVYKKINNTAFEGTEANLLSDGSLNIPLDNKAVLKETEIGIAVDGVKNTHIADNAVTTTKIADENVTAAKLKGGAAKQLLITNEGGKAQWVDASDAIIQEIITVNEKVTLLTDNTNGTFTYKNEADIANGTAGITFNANTLSIADNGKGKYVFSDKSGIGALATIDIQGTIIENITELLKEVSVKEEIYNTIAAQGKKVSTDNSIAVVGGEKAALNEMTISLRDGGVTTAKISSSVAGTNADLGAVLTADGSGKVAYKKLSNSAFEGAEANLVSDGSLDIPVDNKAVLKETNISIAAGGVQAKHIADKNVTTDKIGTTEAAGKVLTSTGLGGAEFQTLKEVIGSQGKEIKGDNAIKVVGGTEATLTEVKLSLNDSSITNEKLAIDAVSTDKIQNQAVTAAKMKGEEKRTILITDALGDVRWADANENVIKDIVKHNESVTVLKDNKDGTFTYYNENDVDHKGNIKVGATGVNFNANTLSADTTTPGVFILKDRSKANGGVVATIDTRASHIIFEGDVSYNTVEEAITNITQKIEQLETEKGALSGEGILVNGLESVDKSVLKNMKLTIADEAVTTTKIKGGAAKQLLITNEGGKAQWVDATDSIIEEIVKVNEKVTVLTDNTDGTFTYRNEDDIANGTAGITFNANTLTIADNGSGKYTFLDKSGNGALATIDIQGIIIENITELLKEVSVKEEIYNTIAAQGKTISTDNAITVVGGEKAALNEMTISLRDGGVTEGKVAKGAITEDKLFAGLGKADYVPVVQADGTVKYQPMAVVPTGKMLTVDNSLKVSGDASQVLLQELGLEINAGGIATEHIQNLAVTSDKITSQLGEDIAKKGSVLIADGSGNTAFVDGSLATAAAMQGDLVGDDAIGVSANGANVLYGADGTEVKVSLKAGGVKGTHVAPETIKNGNIGNKTIEANKLNAGAGVADRVAVANATGEVTYKALSTKELAGKGDIKTADGITVDNGVGKVLGDVSLGIRNQSIAISKLDGGNAPEGAVPVVGANGKDVSYQVLNANIIKNKGNIITDGSLLVSENGLGKTLEDVTINVAPKGIKTEKIADNAVTNLQIADLAVTAAKISPEGAAAKSVLTTKDDGTVFWGELKDIVTNTAGNLTTDNIITLTKGTGVNTLLADAELSIANNSIDRTKLSSKEAGVPVGKDKILVSNDTGGFDLVDQTAVQVGGKDLALGQSLAFTKGDGLNAVLVETSIDVATGGITTDKLANSAVTVDKMSAGTAVANTVLTSVGAGKVEYKALSNTAFDGQGADLKSDGSITVSAGNKALLKETSIAIKDSGVETKHLKAGAVTTDKISSASGVNNIAPGAFLVADGSGATKYQTMETVATAQGKAITSHDGSLTIPDNKAGMQALDIALAKGGVKNEHIGGRAITQENISTPETSGGLVLTSDGQGGAEFKNVNESIVATAKPLTAGAGIIVTGSGAAKALLGDATVAIGSKGVATGMIADKAVKEAQLADGAVTVTKIGTGAVTGIKIANSAVSTTQLNDKAVNTAKMSSDKALSGHVLTADGKGGVSYLAPAGPTTTGELKGTGPIKVTDGKDAVLKDMILEIVEKSIQNSHIADGAITTNKIGKEAVRNGQIAENAVGRKEIYPSNIDTAHLSNGAVTTDKIANDNITNYKILDGAVTNNKMSAGNAVVGHVLTVEAGGKVAYKAATGQSVTKATLTGSGPISINGGSSSTETVLKAVNLDIKKGSITGDHIESGAIQNKHITTSAVDSKQIKNGAVQGDVIKNEGVRVEKLSSLDYNDDQAPDGQVLTSNGRGGVEWRTGGGSSKGAMPKFFYAPSFYITVESGDSGEVDVHDYYVEQFGTPKSVNPGAQKPSLPVLGYNELDYYVLYYDEEVFSSVEIDDGGVLHYEVRDDAQVSNDTYFNIVFRVRD
ncbi:hypothetical protein [Myroides sp. N17-2]|uniref:hypothetical protein n=1 Tax=Myroides sp. N17-2 TaxID=2030799 RepID=UPI000EFD37B9|nr:hypothetical protein [Myroides sp. N17-2]